MIKSNYIKLYLCFNQLIYLTQIFNFRNENSYNYIHYIIHIIIIINNKQGKLSKGKIKNNKIKNTAKKLKIKN